MNWKTNVNKRDGTHQELEEYILDLTDVAALAARIRALETVVGDADSGLVKDVADLKSSAYTGGNLSVDGTITATGDITTAADVTANRMEANGVTVSNVFAPQGMYLGGNFSVAGDIDVTNGNISVSGGYVNVTDPVTP